MSLLEIYNEQIKDLVESHDLKGDLKKLDVKNDPNGGTYVTELTTRKVECIEDVLQVTRVCVCLCVCVCMLFIECIEDVLHFVCSVVCVVCVQICVCVCVYTNTHTHTHAPGDERGDAQPLNEQHQHELSEQPEPLHLLRPRHLHRCHYGE